MSNPKKLAESDFFYTQNKSKELFQIPDNFFGKGFGDKVRKK